MSSLTYDSKIICEGDVMDIQDTKQQRQAFEAWVASNGRNIEHFSDGSYKSMTLDKEWEAWQAAKAQAIPEGFVLVPKEPTQEMLDSARDWSIKKYGKAVGNDGTYGCYKAMIAAAQEQNGVSND